MNHLIAHSVQKIKKFILLMISYVFLSAKGIETNSGDVILLGFPIIHKHKGSEIKLGRGVSLISQSKYNFAGINRPVMLSTVSKDAKIEIGNNSGVSGLTIVSATSVKIGNNTLIGANTNIYDTDFHNIDPDVRLRQTDIKEAPTKRIIIGNNVWIGGGCTILKGVEISDESVIGAGSIVTRDVPKREVWGGSPAKFIKKI